MRLPLHRTLSVLVGLLPLTAAAADPAAPAPTPEIRTPPAPSTPRINGPRVYGARPSHPFFYHLPVTGEKPVTFAATGLPSGLKLDPGTGNVTGTTADRGTFPVTFTATNAAGSDKATINVVIGDTICLTPPLGWNSWNHFAAKVTDADVRAAADAIVSSGLIDHGWTYVNIDDCWQGERDTAGNITGNAKFPNLKDLGDYVHGKSLKFGIYTSPGPKTCGGYNASYQHEDQDARTYADLGVDYVKYDLCSYGKIIGERLHGRTAALLPPDQQPVYETLSKEVDELRRIGKRTPEQDARLKELNIQLDKLLATLDQDKLKAFNRDEQQIPYRVFGQSLAKVSRDIVYSFCQYGNADVWTWGAALGGNCWRTTDDIKATWASMSGIGFKQDQLAPYAGPGHWNDPDMLEVGNAGLTADECYTHMTLWCMLSAPLLIGCDLSKMDPLTLSMFSNDEVLAVNQDALGQQGHRLKADGTSEVWVKPLADGTLAVAFFNRGEQPAEIGVSSTELLAVEPMALRVRSGVPPLRDVWRQKTLPDGSDLKATVAAHGAELWRVGAPTTTLVAP